MMTLRFSDHAVTIDESGRTRLKSLDGKPISSRPPRCPSCGKPGGLNTTQTPKNLNAAETKRFRADIAKRLKIEIVRDE